MFEIVNGLLSEGQKSSQSSDSAASQDGPSSQSWESAKEEMKKVATTHARRGKNVWKFVYTTILCYDDLF